MSWTATVWAIDQRSIPLDTRFVLVAIADRHCPDNGCAVEPENLCAHLAISHAELHTHLEALAAAGLPPPPIVGSWRILVRSRLK